MVIWETCLFCRQRNRGPYLSTRSARKETMARSILQDRDNRATIRQAFFPGCLTTLSAMCPNLLRRFYFCLAEGSGVSKSYDASCVRREPPRLPEPKNRIPGSGRVLFLFWPLVQT